MDYSLDVVGQAVGGIGATGIFGFANIIKTAGKALQGIKKNAEAIISINSMKLSQKVDSDSNQSSKIVNDVIF